MRTRPRDWRDTRKTQVRFYRIQISVVEHTAGEQDVVYGPKVIETGRELRRAIHIVDKLTDFFKEEMMI